MLSPYKVHSASTHQTGFTVQLWLCLPWNYSLLTQEKCPGSHLEMSPSYWVTHSEVYSDHNYWLCEESSLHIQTRKSWLCRTYSLQREYISFPNLWRFVPTWMSLQLCHTYKCTCKHVFCVFVFVFICFLWGTKFRRNAWLSLTSKPPLWCFT